MSTNFKMLTIPKGDPGQFLRYSMYKHTIVQKLNRSKKVTVGVRASTTQTTHTPGFIPNFHWYRTTDKTSYSNNKNSVKQVPHETEKVGYDLQQWLLLLKLELGSEQHLPSVLQQLPPNQLLPILEQLLPLVRQLRSQQTTMTPSSHVKVIVQ